MSKTEFPTERDDRSSRPPDVPGASPGAPKVGDDRRQTSARRWPSFVWAGVVCTLAALMLAGGAWVLWMDRVDRDAAGFVQIESGRLHTDTYAIVSDLQGNGPDWLYGSTIFGDARARVTSDNGKPVFVGIARAGDVANYLDGTGYATVDHLASGDLTPHSGGAPSTPPSRATIWRATTAGTGEQSIVWSPRSGDWRIVMMNADGSAGVAVHGDVGAEFPPAPWVALGLLVAGALLAVLGGWLLVRAFRRNRVIVIE
jgi:hypothetical protein